MMAFHGSFPLGRTSLAFTIVCCGLATGCGKLANLVPATGLVRIGGKPADGIMVQFLPKAIEGEKRPSSFAMTEDDGSFTLFSQDGRPGAVVGDHTVLLTDSMEDRPEPGQQSSRPSRLDYRYGTFMGGLKATVTEGGEPIVLEVPKRP